MELEALRIFLRVAELKSFTRAAEQLGLAKARASVRVCELEAALGTRLLLRTTRMVRLTEEGEQLYQRARRLVAEADEVQSMFAPASSGLRGRLRLDLPVSLARTHVIPRLPEFLALHPQLELLVSTTDRRVDLLREGFDCVLRVGALSDSGLMVKRLGALSMANCASPAYLARYGMPRTIADLDRHFVVGYSSTFDRAGAEFEYRDGGRTRTRRVRAAVTVNGSDAGLAGLGIIQAPRIGMRQALADGRLLEVLPDFPCEPMPVSLVHGHGHRPPKRVRALMSWLGGALVSALRESESAQRT